ncbi:uncharacterized protein LOC111703237 [Eurytemora carolleeae]|uniref:uncharacterized protein LOC111703237 n=1 Tax=Eurytemora carolleeae TaxID=1294199 RepID=UPI000C75E6A1|nr:uncharacterized protein LOC111703237 [Eurytemora carolleeae]|eukprot:XP_023330893.1 uncharacterized protein LOC111703237 [Eurytemora affinis]
MTDNKDRGCVKVELNVEKIPTTTVCNTTGLSKLEYLRTRLNMETDSLEVQFKATQVYLDSCSVFTPFSEWALVAMGLSAGIIASILLVAFFTKSGFKFSKPQDAEMLKQNEKNTNSYWEKIN